MASAMKFVNAKQSAMAKGDNCAYGPTLHYSSQLPQFQFLDLPSLLRLPQNSKVLLKASKLHPILFFGPSGVCLLLHNHPNSLNCLEHQTLMFQYLLVEVGPKLLDGSDPKD